MSKEYKVKQRQLWKIEDALTWLKRLNPALGERDTYFNEIKMVLAAIECQEVEE